PGPGAPTGASTGASSRARRRVSVRRLRRSYGDPMAVPRPGPRDDADPPGSDDDRDEEVLAADPARPGDHATVVLDEPDTETVFAPSPGDRPGWHVRLFGSHEFFRLWLVQVVSSLGDWLGFSAIILLAGQIGGGAGAGAISLVMAARI